MTVKKKRNPAVRPPKGNTEAIIAPVDEGHGDLDAGHGADATEDDEGEQRELENNVEELHYRMTQQLEDPNDESSWRTPIIKAPQQPTKEEWARHCVIHIPYAPHGAHIARQARQ